jgi:subtilisin family serine protease
LVKLLYDKGILVVTAAGNNGPEIGTIGCPANAIEAIAVGAVNIQKRVADFSSRGYIDQKKPDLLSSGFNNMKNVTVNSGTSFASPIVAGISACMRTRFPDIAQLRDIICNGTEKIKALNNEQGNGVLSIKRLLEVLDDETVYSKSL